MFIHQHTIRALSKDSFIEAMDEFFEAEGTRPRHLLVSKPLQIIGAELALSEGILLSFISALPHGAWMLCSDSAIYIGGDSSGKHTIIMWKD